MIEPVENSEIVKGYEYSKGKYLIVEPDEIANLRIETKNVIDVQQFVDLDELPLALFEKPYFVVPEPKESARCVCGGSQSDGGGEERRPSARLHSADASIWSRLPCPGRSLQRRDDGIHSCVTAKNCATAREYFSETSELSEKQHIDKKQLAMATQLIEAYSHPFNLDAFKDDYEAALRELIEAKQKNVPLPLDEERAKPAKVINLMDALRQSVSKAKRPVASERPA